MPTVVSCEFGVHSSKFRVLLALEAMKTRFELVLEGDDGARLRAAGEEALREIERLDARLSRYRAASVVSALNAHAAAGRVLVDGEVLGLLRACAEVSAASGGAFDIAVGPLVDAWRLAGEAGRLPEPDALEAARACSGMAHVAIDDAASAVRFLRPGVSLDFGAAGKGYAIDRAVECLREAGVTRALLHGGTSSVHAIGVQQDGRPWPIAWDPEPGRDEARVTFQLSDQALAISATHGRSFEFRGRTYGHVVDPRTGEPVRGVRSAAVRGPSSFMCDMLSTALLVRGPEWADELRARWPEYEGTLRAARPA
jgi:thiamine biosynthesis lipoprotein